MTMTDEELITTLRAGRAYVREQTIGLAADRLEALTQPSGKVSDEQVRAGVFRAITALPNDAVGILNKKPFGVTLESVVRSILEAAQLPARPVVSENDPRWIMGGTLAPTDSEIRDAANKWCGDKERETFLSDVTYFRNNWRALNGLKAYVAREVSSRADLAEKRIAALSALEGEGHE